MVQMCQCFVLAWSEIHIHIPGLPEDTFSPIPTHLHTAALNFYREGVIAKGDICTGSRPENEIYHQTVTTPEQQKTQRTTWKWPSYNRNNRDMDVDLGYGCGLTPHRLLCCCEAGFQTSYPPVGRRLCCHHQQWQHA